MDSFILYFYHTRRICDPTIAQLSTNNPHSHLRIPHSDFRIPHSHLPTLLLPHSEFRIPTSQFPSSSSLFRIEGIAQGVAD
jgi:hypothetical protein